MVDRFLEELASGAAPAPADGTQDFSHVTGGGEAFRVTVLRRESRVVHATFRPSQAGVAREPVSLTAPSREGPGRATPLPPGSSVAGGAGQTEPSSPKDSPGRSAAGAGPGLEAAPAAEVPLALRRLLGEAVARGASDLFLSTGRPARWRIHGVLSTLGEGIPGEGIPGEGELEALLAGQLTARARARLAEHGSVDMAFGLPAAGGGVAVRFRVSLFREEQGLAAAFRVLRPRAPTLEELGLPPSVMRLVEHRHGLVLMVGPTGSGKSTTLAGLIEQLNGTVARHVITIEDPIELRYVPRRCLIHQREVGAHVSSFADGIRSALRSSPDVILVGEMRDPETIAAALTAAETGHLVLSTLHCGTAGMAVDRIVDAFPEARQNQVRLQLSDVLRSVVSQRLLPATGGGRVPALEILHVTRAVASLIREGRGHQIESLIQTGRDAGMVPLARSLAELVRAGRVSVAAAMEAADDPAALQTLLVH